VTFKPTAAQSYNIIMPLRVKSGLYNINIMLAGEYTTADVAVRTIGVHCDSAVLAAAATTAFSSPCSSLHLRQCVALAEALAEGLQA